MKDGTFTADRLLALYDRVAEAEDAIPRLRRFVLDLAVRGKLTERGIKKGEVRSLGTVAEFVMGQAPPGEACNTSGDGTLFVKVGEFGERYPEQRAWTTQPLKFARQGDVLICVVGATVGKLNLGVDCAIGRSVAAIRPNAQLLAAEYLHYSLMPFTLGLREGARGSAQGVISKPDLARLSVWLPPLAEQQRIVAKVDDLIALCDKLEQARAGREAVRDRLTAATWARLTAPETDAETFPTHARAALQTLPTLTTRPNQIKTLRQTILNLAMRGKLVEQDPNDEPAAELLKRIGGEIAAYSKSERITQTLPAPVGASEQEFDLPGGWSWTRLCGLFKVITDGDHQPPPKADHGIAFLTIGNVTTGKLDFEGCRTVPAAYFDALPRYRTPSKGDILYTVVGATYGRPALVETDRPFCVQRHIAIMKPSASMDLRFLLHLLASPMVYDQATRGTTGTAQPTVALRPLRNFVIALPPLAEQHRIVAKVDALMALCDQLEASLTTATTTRSCLLEALLHEALGSYLAIEAGGTD